MKTAIYTAIYDRYDPLFEQPRCPGVDYFCFTEDDSLASDLWEIVVSRPRYEHPRMAAKWFKTHPHVALADYRYTIYIDATVRLKTETFVQEVMQWLGSSGLALLRHHKRDNIFDEAELSMRMDKYQGQPIAEQVAHYRAQGFESDNGLYSGGVLLRDNEVEVIRSLGEAWMAENLKWSYQDQLSLPYLLWRFGVTPDVMPYAIFDNDLFEVKRDWELKRRDSATLRPAPP